MFTSLLETEVIKLTDKHPDRKRHRGTSAERAWGFHKRSGHKPLPDPPLLHLPRSSLNPRLFGYYGDFFVEV